MAKDEFSKVGGDCGEVGEGVFINFRFGVGWGSVPPPAPMIGFLRVSLMRKNTNMACNIKNVKPASMEHNTGGANHSKYEFQ